LQLDDHLKNCSVNWDTRSTNGVRFRPHHGAIAGVRAHGYDIVLKAGRDIGLAKRDAAAAEAAKLTTQDRRFLESLRIQVDQDPFWKKNRQKPAPKLPMTPKTLRF